MYATVSDFQTVSEIVFGHVKSSFGYWRSSIWISRVKKLSVTCFSDLKSSSHGSMSHANLLALTYMRANNAGGLNRFKHNSDVQSNKITSQGIYFFKILF